MRILVADDDIGILQLVSIHLIREGDQVERASDVQQALVLLEEVDLDIGDVMMTGMKGFELTNFMEGYQARKYT